MRQPDRIIRMSTVRDRTGLSRSTIYRKIAEGTFPAQLKISTNGAGWHEPTSIAGSPTPPDGGHAASSTSMTSDRGDDKGQRRPANDNRPPDGQNAEHEADASGRLDAVVLTIARLIGRRMAREDFEKAMRAANDNAPKAGDEQDDEAET